MQFNGFHFISIKNTNIEDHNQILAILQAEEIHFIAKSAARSDRGIGASGTTTGINAKTVYLTTVDDVWGRKVGVWGGAVITE